MTNEELDLLLTLLSKHNITRFKNAGLEIEFGPQTSNPPVQAQHPAKDTLLEAELPIDLRADELMKADAILNWSSPDAHEDLALTMAGT